MIDNYSQKDKDFFCNGNNEYYYPSWFLNKKISLKDCRKILMIFIQNLKLNYLNIVLQDIVWDRDKFILYFIFFDTKEKFKIKIKRKNNNFDNLANKVDTKYFNIIYDDNLDKKKKIIILALCRILDKIKPADLFLKIFFDKNKIILKDYVNEFIEPRDHGDSMSSLNEFPFFEWGNTHIKFLFIYQDMIKKGLPSLIVNEQGSYEIEYADYECSRMGKKHKNNHLSILNFDVVKFNSDTKGDLYALEDNDIIFGAIDKLKKILLDLVKSGTNKRIGVNCTCTPLIIGEDVKSLIQSIEEQNDIKIFYRDPVEDDTMKHNLQYINDVLQSLPNKNSTKQKKINLVGYPKTEDFQEIVKILKIFDIEINSQIIPEFNKSLMSKYYEAQLQVIFDKDELRDINEIFKTLDIDSLILLPPYGFDLTNKWLNAILKKYDLNLEDNKFWQSEYEKYLNQWRFLKKKAHNFRLGLILSDLDFNNLINYKKNLFSTPLILLLQEMGFALDFLIYTSVDKYDNYKNNLISILNKDHDYTIKYCNDYNELITWLAFAKFNVIFSDLTFDKRLSSLGKVSFNLRDFEMGYAGAVRSLEKIINKCELQFYSKYSQYFNEIKQPINIE